MPEQRGMIGTLERILYLKKLPVFAHLPLDALAAIAEVLRERQFPRGAVVQREGEAVGRIQIVLDGEISVSRNGLPLAPVGPGTPMGALPVLARDSHGFSGVARSDTFALELDSEALLEVCEDHFEIVHQVLRYLSHWVVSIEQKRGPQGRPGEGRFSRLATGELDLVERIFFLRQITPFARSSISALAELSRGLTEVHFQSGVPLWVEGDAAHYVLLIVDGRVGCESAAHGHRFEANAGQAVAAMEAVAEVPHWFSATTQTPVAALHGTIEGLIDVFEDNFEMAMDYAAVLARGLMSYLERAGPAAEIPLTPYPEERPID
jgi:signal-transduction protein with cAMP-binding, CBS, and nucleotidyltransferase domain